MKTFLNFIKEADVPTNVTGAVVSTDPVVTKKSSNKYITKNKKEAPKLKG